MAAEARGCRRGIKSRRARAQGLVGLAALLSTASTEAYSLVGSKISLARQVEIAQKNDFTFLETAADVRRLTSLGLLVPVRGNRDYLVRSVSFAVARPELKTFVERFAMQYHRACGRRLVVTSLTRPASRQPANAYRESVHRAGMAVDLRRSSVGRCRAWLEETLLALEHRNVLEATRERHPPHYHVALFPRRYSDYLQRGNPRPATAEPVDDGAANDRYAVREGDTLWGIARARGTTVGSIVNTNALASVRLLPGQILRIPR